MAKIKRTILYEEHRTLGARMVEFGGWEMPVQYPSGIIGEHLATRKFGGIFDISHMGRFLISGRDALSFLQHVLTNNAAALVPEQSQYTIIPNDSGGAVDDAYLYRLNEAEYILAVNAANLEKDWSWFQKHKQNFPRLVLEDYTDRIAMIALQGPRTKAVLTKIIGDKSKLPPPIRNSLATVEILGARVLIARTGYTGEPVCFELFPPAEIAVSLWQELLQIGEKEGIVPVGLGARDTLRLEASLPLYGHELGQDTGGKEIPVFALPMARSAVSLSSLKGKFIGREALTNQFREVKLRREGLLVTPEEKQLIPKTILPMSIEEGIARAGCCVYSGEKPVGCVTSGTMVPYWKVAGAGLESRPGDEPGKRAICLAYIDSYLKEGERTKVTIRDKVAAGMIVARHIASEAAPYARPILM